MTTAANAGGDNVKMPDLSIEVNEEIMRACDQRGLRVNLMALALDQLQVYPVPKRYEQLWNMLVEALEPPEPPSIPEYEP